MRRERPCDDIDNLLELMLDVGCSTTPTIRISGSDIPTETVKDRFLQLDSEHIQYVIDALNQTTTKINNIRAYLLTALYNAPVTIGPYYSALSGKSALAPDLPLFERPSVISVISVRHFVNRPNLRRKVCFYPLKEQD